jgi:hypothetical protein
VLCASCGTKNVEFASTCFACGKTLIAGKAEVSANWARSHAPQPVPVPVPEAPRDASGAKKLGRGLALRMLVALAIAWSAAGGFPKIREAFEDLLRSAQEAPAPSPVEPADSAAPAEPSTVTEAPAPPVEQQNGFQLTHFSLTMPEGREGGRFRVGETVRGRSEIKGFDLNSAGELDLVVTFAFRDPNGELVEAISPSVLHQKAESDTLYTDFYYDVAAGATEGHYDLELGVDDAVSGRSARFHRTIPIDPAGEPS